MDVEELKREFAREIIGYLESRGIDTSVYLPNYPKSLLLTALMFMFAQHEKTPCIDAEDLPMLQRIMEKTHKQAQEEYRRARV